MATVAPRNILQATSGATGINDTNVHQMFAAQAVTDNGAAGGAGVTRNLRIYLTDLELGNTSATATVVTILDGSTVIWAGNVSASMGLAAANLSTPLVGSSATSMSIKCATGSSGVIWSAHGYAAQ